MSTYHQRGDSYKPKHKVGSVDEEYLTKEEMAAARPRTAAQLLDVKGMGPKKVESFGERFLAAIAEFGSA